LGRIIGVQGFFKIKGGSNMAQNVDQEWFMHPDAKINIVDTTLRDGEQTAGVAFSNEEKVRIAQYLDQIGVDQIEAGIPVMGGKEKDCIREIVGLGLKASIMAWNRAEISDIKASLECGVDAVAVSVSTSDIHIKHKLRTTREGVLQNMADTVRFAKESGLYVSVSAEDASRSEIEFLVEFALVAKKNGADRLRFCDTIGTLNPQTTFRYIKTLRDAVDLDIEMHTHNDFGMATANSLSGVYAGANYINATVNGLGERAGNSSLQEVIMGLKHLMGIKCHYNTSLLREVAEYVALASNRPLGLSLPIVGQGIFNDESGLHGDGIIRSALTYEVFTPEEIGLTRQNVIGKHSDAESIRAKFLEYGLDLTDQEVEEILAQVRQQSLNIRRALFDKELVTIYNRIKEEI
jgi:homocitrate synthase NifV